MQYQHNESKGIPEYPFVLLTNVENLSIRKNDANYAPVIGFFHSIYPSAMIAVAA